MKVEAIIPAAGSGTRLNSDVPKAFVSLLGEPLLMHAIKVLEASPSIVSIILVVHSDFIHTVHDYLTKYDLKKIKTIVPGGETRAASVSYGLAETDDDTDFVLIHDAARPLLDEMIIKATLEAAFDSGASVAAVPVKPTLKKVDPITSRVEETLDRHRIWEAQTPQVFKRSLLIKAHEQQQSEVTDDAMLVEMMGHPVAVVMGSYQNLKVTTPEDLSVAALWLNQRRGNA